MPTRRTQPLLILLALLAVAGCHTVGQNIPGVDNFAQVDGVLYRGAQPSEQGVATLQEQGIRTIINLRDDPNPAEQTWARHAGMRYVVIPSSPTKVEPAKVRQFLDAVATAPRPVFVHCRQGRDRTGLVVAAYRMVCNRWSRPDALEDLYDHGYHWLIFPGIANYVKTFDPAALQPHPTTQQANASVRPP